MLCPRCGAQTVVTEGSCGSCGAPIDPQASLQAETGPRTPALPADSAASVTHSFPTRPASPSLRQTASEGPLVPGEPFGTRYQILEQLGGGGMGVVYKAWDETIGLEVAIKVIRPTVMADPRHARDLERRFKRELLLARQVTHKNVVRIHDLGEIDGIKYITMSYVDGVDLATILERESKLPIPRALQFARRVVAGLKAAHDAGVVHRDLKPSNIMVDAQDEPLIMDFGIARSSSPRSRQLPADGKSSASVEHGRDETREGATTPGAIVGTLEYMAPEQARGLEADQRADIYAFGLILYDMLVGTGHHKARGRGLEALKARALQTPLSARSLEPEVPEALDSIVTRCLATDPADRHQTAAELDADLARLDENGHPLPLAWRIGRRQIAAAALAGAMVVAGTWWFSRTPLPPTEPAPLSVLIADFANTTGDQVFEGSLEHALAVGVEAASFVTSYPREQALRMAAEIAPDAVLDEATARLVSIRESVDIVLAGAIRRAGSGYAISVEVADPSEDEPLLVIEASARDRDEVLETVASVAKRVRRGLGDTSPANDAGSRRETFTAASLEAAHAYSLAQSLYLSYRDEEALEHYQRATELDPGFGRAWAGWGYSLYRLGRLEESRSAWEKALASLDRMSEREKYRTLGLYYGTISRNYEKAIESYETLLEVYPADDAAHNNLAMCQFSTRNFAQAMEEGRRALEIYPNRLMYRVNHALFAMYASDFATSEAEARRVLEDDPAAYDAHLPLAIAALARSDFDAARQAYRGLAEGGEYGASLSTIGLADMALYRGRYDEAVDVLTPRVAIDEKADNRGFLAAEYVALAAAHQGRGEKRAALGAAETALELGAREEVMLPAARIFIWAGDPSRAGALASELDSQLEAQSRAYARMIQGEIALKEERMVDALEAFNGALELVDHWFARFDLGVLFVKTGRYAEALPEFEMCERRRGEASAVFLDDIPTVRYMAPVPYWLGRAQEGLGMRDAAKESYARYLATRPEGSGEPLATDARVRHGLLSDRADSGSPGASEPGPAG